MPIESNTGSQDGQGGWKRGTKPPLRVRDKGGGETRYLVPAETPRERMTRVVKAAKKKR